MATKTEKVHFQNKLAELMDKQSLNQLQLAEHLGIRQSQISIWLNGKTLPTYTNIQLLKNFFKVPADDFFEVSNG